ncbi:MAG: endolytic transglycosylase MltG [Caulobacteraceae bacterium]
MALLVLFIAGGAGVALFSPGPPARRGKATDVVLSAGARLPAIAGQLGRAGVVRSPLLFMIAAEASGSARSLKAGEYSFQSRDSLAAVMNAVRAGRVVRHFVTIPEGLTSAQTVAILDRAAELSGPAPMPPEGSLLPETYEVSLGESRAHVLARMRAARDALLARLWARRPPGLTYRSPEQAVILASIVEKETALANERPHIARVFLNRLDKGMRLESDPTVVYGLTGGTPLGHGLKVSELRDRTPYNTYFIAGLPPTPIANPGRAALEAALDPTPSADLYFVANGTGGHVFSATLEDHLRNVARWRSIEQARAALPAHGPVNR